MKQHKVVKARKTRRAFRSRNRIRASGTRPRLSVHRSDRHITAQIIDDHKHQTLAYATTVGKKAELGNGGNIDGAKAVGKKIAELAIAKGVKQVAFDRGPFRYHGRIKALAEAARQAGLEF
ncbi:MAG: 50S ribosomal protein L18 [Planctomycetes bacterium]|nr:50S ribosomal protein L18 [Planctomycetota bacterium]MCW8136474.1 50S ribosomal protein L18 [Planctomycetota bacterium]